jgi:hypothetical protein
MALNVYVDMQVTYTNSPSAFSSAVATIAKKYLTPTVVTINMNSLRISPNNNEHGIFLQNETSSQI